MTPVNTNAAAILENQIEILRRFDQQTRMIAELRLSEANVEANISALTAELDQVTLRLSEVGFIESPVAVASASPVAVATDLTSSTVGVSIALNLISFSFVHRY